MTSAAELLVSEHNMSESTCRELLKNGSSSDLVNIHYLHSVGGPWYVARRFQIKLTGKYQRCLPRQRHIQFTIVSHKSQYTYSLGTRFQLEVFASPFSPDNVNVYTL